MRDSAVCRWFESTIAAACESILIERCAQGESTRARLADDAAHFVLSQHARMPDPFRTPFVLVTLALSGSSLLRHGRRFHRLSHAARWQQLERWRSARLGVCKDFVRFVESFVILYWHARVFPGDRTRSAVSVPSEARTRR